MYCHYYQATIKKDKTWFVTGSLRSEPGIVFDRALDPKAELHEFFVAPDSEEIFLKIMKSFEDMEIVFNLHKCPNRVELLGHL